MRKFLILLSFIFFTLSSTFAQSQPYVLLVSFDGFRWDYLNRGLTPNLNRLAQNGVKALSLKPVFPSKTFPNHISIITGMYAENHGIIANHFENPFTGEVYKVARNSKSVLESKWYLGEAFWTTARRNGIVTASYFWPGSELEIEYRRPNYFQHYEHNRPYKTRIDGVMDWLQLPYKKRPHFITLYFHETDSYGHGYGPNSPEVNNAIKLLDSLTGYLTTRLQEIGMRDSVNIIFVSDHGMTGISPGKTINIENILKGFQYKMGGEKPFVMIEPENEKDLDLIYNVLKKHENHYTVYKKKDLPEYFHYSKHPFISSIIVIADLGWSLVNNKWLERFKRNKSKGNHGYPNYEMDMHGIFIANGPAFKKSLRTGTIQNIDIYPLLCKIFNIEPRSNIDGKLERIGFILK